MDTITLTYADGATDYSREFDILGVKGFLPGDAVQTFPDVQPRLLSGSLSRYSVGFRRLFTVDFGVIDEPADTRFLINFLTKAATNKKTNQRLTYSYYWQLQGTISNSGTTVTGTGTLFTTELIVGSQIRSASGEIRVVESITSDTVLTTGSAFTTLSGSLFQLYVPEVDLEVLYEPGAYENTWMDNYMFGRQFVVTLTEKAIRTAYPTGAILTKAASLDGSTEYASKATPANLDMNGAETITDTDDSDFETDIGNWTDPTTLLVSRTTTNPIVGTGSLIGNYQFTTGSRASDYISLPAAAFTTLVAGTKYTIEFLANSSVAATTLGVALGAAGQTMTSGVLTTTPGSGTKVVWNFTATSADVGQGLRIWPSTNCNVRIDSVSITVAYDFTTHVWFNTTNATAADRYLLTRWHATLAGFQMRLETAHKPRIAFGDGTTTVAVTSSGSAVNNGAWHLFSVTVSRTGNVIGYIDGAQILSSSVTAVGKWISTQPLEVGHNGAASFFPGSLGEIQWIRGYAMTAAEILDIFNTGIKSSYDNGTVVAHYRWRGATDAAFLNDESASANDLTGTNLTQAADQVAAYYASSDE